MSEPKAGFYTGQRVALNYEGMAADRARMVRGFGAGSIVGDVADEQPYRVGCWVQSYAGRTAYFLVTELLHMCEAPPCPNCNAADVVPLWPHESDRYEWECGPCGYQFSIDPKVTA